MANVQAKQSDLDVHLNKTEKEKQKKERKKKTRSREILPGFVISSSKFGDVKAVCLKR